MRLQRVTNRARGEKVYHKWQVTIPPDTIEALGWEAGDNLRVEVSGDRLVLSRG